MRIRAQALDLIVIAAWVGFAAAVGFTLRAAGVRLDSAQSRDAVAFATLVLPVTVTFAVQEASPSQATFGKRRRGLAVEDRHGRRISLPRSLARSGVKFLPWQLAHTAVFGLFADSTSSWLITLSVAAQALVIGSAAMMALDSGHLALHDRVAGTRVKKVVAGPGL